MTPDDREPLGRIAWETFVAWACEQPGMTVRRDRWEDLSDEEREMSMRIGSAVAAQAVADERRASERMRIHRLHAPVATRNQDRRAA